MTANAVVDLQMLDSGTAKATISFVDAAGLATVPVTGATVATTATMSNPAIVATVDPTGLVVNLAPSVPPVLATGVVLTVSVTITNPDATVLGPFTGTGNPIDVVGSAIAGVSLVEADN
jgi:hypothetical protein